MFRCAACQAEIPVDAAFCPSCGKEAEDTSLEIAAKDVTRAWLMDMLTQLGYTCEPDNESSSSFFAKHEQFSNIGLDVRQNLGVVGINAYFTAKRSRRDEADLLAALNNFNQRSLWWSAYEAGTSIGFSTIMALGAKTSPRVVAAFLEHADNAIFPIVQNTQLAKFLL